MKKIYLFFILGIIAVHGQVLAQDNTLTKRETDRVDSIADVRASETEDRYERARNEDQIELLAEKVKHTEREAREAKRVAKEAKQALRAEKKAQKARDRADRLATKSRGN